MEHIYTQTICYPIFKSVTDAHVEDRLLHVNNAIAVLLVILGNYRFAVCKTLVLQTQPLRYLVTLKRQMVVCKVHVQKVSKYLATNVLLVFVNCGDFIVHCLDRDFDIFRNQPVGEKVTNQIHNRRFLFRNCITLDIWRVEDVLFATDVQRKRCVTTSGLFTRSVDVLRSYASTIVAAEIHSVLLHGRTATLILKGLSFRRSCLFSLL